MSDIETEIVKQLAKDVYSDALKKSVIPTGNVASLIPRTINVALSKYDVWLTKKELNIDYTKQLIAKKFIDVPEDKITTPEAYVAIPAAQAISYSIGSEELCNMYANLLAKSMHVDTMEQVHPSFVEIIKQLSPVDARMFDALSEKSEIPILDLWSVDEKSGNYIVLDTNITGLSIAIHPLMSIAIDNLVRLGLLHAPDAVISDDEVYRKIKSSNEYKLVAANHRNPYRNNKTNNRLLNLTDMGKVFRSVCIVDSFPSKLPLQSY